MASSFITNIRLSLQYLDESNAASASQQLYRAILASLTSRYAAYAVQLLSLMILARVFTPQQYGVIASVQVIYVFFQLIADIGFGPAIINLRRATRAELGGIFTITLAVGTVLPFIFWPLSSGIQHFYSNHELAKVVPFAACALFFYASAIVPTACLNRDMQFFSLARANICSEVFSTGGVLLLQCRIDPVVALASKNLIYGLVQFVCVYAFSAKTEFGAPKPSIDFSGARRILWFSTYQFSFSFVNYFSRNLDNVLVGRVMGAASLGVYDKAYQLMKYPLMLLTFGMTPAIQPALAKHTGDAKSCERIHRDFVKRLSWIGIVAALFVVLGASTIVRVILGPKWQPVTPIIRQLGLGVGPQVVLSTIGSFFQAMQRPDLLFGTGMASCLMIVSAIAIGIWKSDLVLMAWLISTAFNASFLLAYFVLYTFVFRVSPQRFYRQLRLQIASNVSILILGSPFTSRMAHEICAYIQSS